jgi:hypothetical protein
MDQNHLQKQGSRHPLVLDPNGSKATKASKALMHEKKQALVELLLLRGQEKSRIGTPHPKVRKGPLFL